MVKGTKPYIETLAWQINASYQYRMYDGCSVMMRRLTESLLIEAFVKAGHVQSIREGGEFKMLGTLIGMAAGGQYIMLARGTSDILDAVKYVGDRSAHSRSYIAHRKDIDDLTYRFRTIVVELLTLADIHPTK